jgi:ankyrin repeat protein
MNIENKPTLFRPGIGKRGMNALHYAAYCGDMNELRRQLEEGANPNATDEYRGYTAVHWLADMSATGGPRVQMLRLLAAQGADLCLKSENGETALSLARAAGTAGSEQLVEELVLLGASSNSADA